ncbi:hypothetical protein, partial [Streptomyces sp. NPDC127574]|uniref:hypothetical protein n=1 Tax=Streptomyces sp. NPDC127574 TaxID=3345401 RepID=UPI003641CB5B
MCDIDPADRGEVESPRNRRLELRSERAASGSDPGVAHVIGIALALALALGKLASDEALGDRLEDGLP